MGLINQDNRVKRDISGARTANDVIRRFPDLDKVVIKAGQIEMEGYTSINGGFKIDNDGNMECNNATMKNATFTSDSTTEYADLTERGLCVYNNQEKTKYGSISNDIVGVYKALDYPGSIWNPLAYISIENDYYGYFCLSNLNSSETITANGNTGNITCVSLTQTSKEEYKKNFEKLENALDIVKATDIYKYNLKNEKETDKKHIGIVIGDSFNYRKEITSKENDGVYLYSMVSVLWKAVQEQQKEIEELKKVIK